MPRYTFTTELEPGLHVAGLPKHRYGDPAVRAAVRIAFRAWRGTYTPDEMSYRMDGDGPNDGLTLGEMFAKYPMRVRNADNSDYYLQIDVRDWDVESGDIEPGYRTIVACHGRYTMCRVGYGTGERWERPMGYLDNEYDRILEEESK